MKLNFITIFVQDLERSVSFYQTVAGLQVVRRLQPACGRDCIPCKPRGRDHVGVDSASSGGIRFC